LEYGDKQRKVQKFGSKLGFGGNCALRSGNFLEKKHMPAVVRFFNQQHQIKNKSHQIQK
jgi:hypothetical protein